MRKLFLLIVTAVVALSFAPSANAAIPSALGITCTVQPAGPNDGQRWCGSGVYNPNQQDPPVNTRSTVESFDGVPIDVNVAFPSTDGDGPYPLVMMFHGYGGGKMNFPQMQRWLDKGYAVISQTNRGFHESCGTPNAKAADPDCETKGFVRLDDTRYEVRDAQLFAGMLVDEGLIEPTKIAATGGSYGGGMSMSLAALKDRTMEENGDLVDWESPDGTPMSLAVAIPNIPWTDLAYSLVPNGSNIDYIKDASYFGRFGVMKQSFVNGLYLSGITSGEGYYTDPGLQPSADLRGWKAFMDLGEPYEGKPAADQMLDEVTTYHSSYYIDHSQAPAPLMISSGFTDDLFPANEATRYYNRTRAEYPSTPLALFFGDFGHMRAANKNDVRDALTTQENAWVDYYLKNDGSQPVSNVTSYTQTCPDTPETPSGGPYVASDWAASSPGEIRLEDEAPQTVSPDGGTPAVGAAFNPAPAGKSCTAAAGAKEPGTANYELDPAPAGGYTVLGSPTVVAKIAQAGTDSQIAARLVDVSADGTKKTLVNRALWRPAESGFQVFQLNPNAWKVEQGHVLRLELLAKDAGGAATDLLSNYGRPSNNQQPATITQLDLRVPVKESPGALGGLIKAPVKKVLPDRPGVELANGYEAIGSETMAQYSTDHPAPPCPAGTHGTTPPDCSPDICPMGEVGTPPDCHKPHKVVGKPFVKGKVIVKGKVLKAKIKCGIGNDKCSKISLAFKGAPKKGKKGKRLLIAKRRGISARPGQTKTFTIKMTRKARKFFKDKKVRRHGKKKVKRGPNSLRAKVLVNGKKTGFKTVRRVGRVR